MVCALEIRHRVAHDARAAVEERLHLRPRRVQSPFGVARDLQHADPSAGGEQRIQMLAVVVRRLERVVLGEEHALERRQPRIAEEEPALGLPRGQVERVRSRGRRILRLPAQLGEFGPLAADVEPQRRQPLDHLLELDQRALQRREARQAPPVGRPAGHGRPVVHQGREIVLSHPSGSRCPVPAGTRR